MSHIFFIGLFCKYSFMSTQTCPFISMLSMAAFPTTMVDLNSYKSGYMVCEAKTITSLQKTFVDPCSTGES